MKAEIIAIGNEITNGSVLNTHGQYISKKLFDIGIETHYHTTIGDEIEDIKEAIKLSLKRADLIIVTGGLGPTEDDISKDVIAEALNLKLVKDMDMVEVIKEKLSYYDKIPDSNFKQAVKIENSIFLANEVGTAPGIFLDYNEQIVVMLPGPPRELRPMVDKYLIPQLIQDEKIYMKSINIEGLGESYLAEEISDLIHKYKNVNIATFAHNNFVEIKLVGKGSNGEVEKNFQEISRDITSRFEDNIFSYNGESIGQIVMRDLMEKNYKIAFAESCTAGLATYLIGQIPGASNVLEKSIVVYSNQAKVSELGLSQKTLDQYGAVSKETAIEMSQGLLSDKNINIGIGITGIAGPSGDGVTSEVGLVYISLSDPKKTEVHEFHFKGARDYIQDKAAHKALFLLRKFLL